MGAQVILIAGPTASGKSDFAIDMALRNNGVVINADSMQVYDGLQIITARPNSIQTSQVEHLLYGHRSIKQSYSVAAWLSEIGPILTMLGEQDRTAVIVGGTGLYFKTLIDGLSPIPAINPDVREKWREYAHQNSSLYDELVRRDAAAAQQLKPNDHQRIMRALEVVDSTGRSIVYWQNESPGKPLVDSENAKKLVLMPPRPFIHERINSRFENMIKQGAVEEVEALVKLDLDTNLPAMKAIGVAQISSYLGGQSSLEEAIEKSKAASRQYAKRQSTWFNNQFRTDWKRLESA